MLANSRTSRYSVPAHAGRSSVAIRETMPLLRDLGEQDRSGDDERALVLLADLLPELLVRQNLLVFRRGPCSFLIRGSSGRRPAGAGVARRLSTSSTSVQHVGVDHPQVRLACAAGFAGAARFPCSDRCSCAAGEESGDQHALKRRDVELGLDRRLDRDLVEADAAGRGQPAATGYRPRRRFWRS